MIMNNEEKSHSLPHDLVLEILSRLPAKSVARFRRVSKLWGSMLHRPYFKDMFLSRSSARPRLLFALQQADYWCFLTSPQPHNIPRNENSLSLVVAAEFRMIIPGKMWRRFCSLGSCLISKDAEDTFPLTCNPITRMYERLPKVKNLIRYLGFDPVEKQYKVLSMNFPLDNEKDPPQILTLGKGNGQWRKIHCPLDHSPLGQGICINGVLYYYATRMNERHIVCFDVRSEKFKFIKEEYFLSHTKLVNYKGKLGGIRKYDNQLSMWVMKDVEKPSESPEYFYCSWIDQRVIGYVSVVGVTSTGEIVLSKGYVDAYNPFHVFYWNPERNTLQRVEIKGVEAYQTRGEVKVFVDYVEDLNFIK